MLCYRKILVWFLVLFPVFGCHSASNNNGEIHGSNNSNHQGALFFKLPFNFETEKDKDIEQYSDYIKGEYRKILKKGYPFKGTDEQKYIYIRCLYHLDDWDNIIELSKYYEPKSPLYPYIQFYNVQALAEKKYYSVALETYLKHRALFDTIPFADEVDDVYHKILAGLNLVKRVRDNGKYYYHIFQLTGERNALLQAILTNEKRAVKELTVKNYKRIIPFKHVEETANLIKDTKPNVALKLYEHLKNYPMVGQMYFKLKKYNTALFYLDKNSLEASLCRLKNRSADKADIEKAEGDLARSLPFLIDYYYDQKKYDSAAALLVKNYQQGYVRDLILLLFEEKNFNQLQNFLETLKQAKLTVEEKTAVYYWLGNIYLLQKNSNKANACFNEIASKYPNTFYGWHAFKLAENKEEIRKNWKQLAEWNEKNLNEYFSQLQKHAKFPESASVGLFFLKINENQKGLAELKKNLGDLDLYYLALIKFFKSIDRTDMIIKYSARLYKAIAEKADNSILYEDLMKELFLLRFQDAITEASKKHEIPAHLLAAIIRQESNFYIGAISWVGAKGLMQLMPNTAKPILKQLAKKKQIENHSIFDPYTNIMSGSMHLDWLLDTVFKSYDQPYQTILSIASYNAGASRIKRYYSARKDWTPEFFIESIPLFETRDYTKRVLLYQEFYKLLYQL